MITHREIYKRDSTGKTRVWYQQQDGNRYRTVAGILGGNLVESGWTVAAGKQGRSDVEQATFEIEAAYKHKLTREYHETQDTTEQGAHFIKPMLAQTYEGFPGPGYAQPKLDGIRCIATVDGLFSRQGKPIHGVPHIHAALAPAFADMPDLILDGELYNHDLREDFGAISSIVRKANPTAEQLEKAEAIIEYHVYDVIDTKTAYEERAVFLNEVIQNLNCSWIVLVPTDRCGTQAEADLSYGAAIEAGYEGGMFRLDTPYEQKRSKSLLKRKEFIDEEFEVVSIEPGQGNWAGVAKRVTCRLPDGRTFGAGIKGSRDRAAELLHETHKVVTVKYFCLSPDGVPRFPIATQFHGEERTL